MNPFSQHIPFHVPKPLQLPHANRSQVYFPSLLFHSKLRHPALLHTIAMMLQHISPLFWCIHLARSHSWLFSGVMLLFIKCISGCLVQKPFDLPPPPLVLPHPLSFSRGGGLSHKNFCYGSLCCCVGDCVVRHCHLFPLYSWHSYTYQKGQTTNQLCCPKHSSGKWRACTGVQGQVEQDQEILYRGGQGVGLRTLAAL